MTMIDAYLNEGAELLRMLPREPVERVAAILRQARSDGRRVFIFGNGGSAANAAHFTVDILKGTQDKAQPAFKIICLNDNIPTLTALANDIGYDAVFSEPLAALGEPGDVAIAISGSGNSANVLRALAVARDRKLVTIGLTGFSGGKLKDMVDIAIIVPSTSMQHIEDAHLAILHALFVYLKAS